MRFKYLFILLMVSNCVSAQLTISPTAELFVIGDMGLTLHNTDLVNDGIFSPGVNKTSFTGDISSSIGGNGTVRFFQLEINKTGNGSVILQRPVNVVDRVLFRSGFLDLNNFNADLESTGLLEGEREDSRVTGTNGGQLLFTTTLNAPSNVNPGNLGAVISTGENLGDVVIKRGHQSQSGSGLHASILRYYEITPANNVNLSAELEFNYFDSELNSMDENSLVFFKTEDGINWSNEGFTSKNALNKFVVKKGINSFSRWTLSDANPALAVLFILFNVKCEGNGVLLNWKTAREENSGRFDIERSADGIAWTVIGSIPAAGNSSIERAYSFTDANPGQNYHYRVAEYSLDGRIQYTSIARASCNIIDRFTLWPNPVHDVVSINITTNVESPAIIEIFDSKGALIKLQKETVLRGSNQLKINIGKLAGGVYLLRAHWNNGQLSRSVRIVKL